MGRAGREERCIRHIEYDPLPSQVLFHNSCARFKGFSGPIGSGKSQALCEEAIKLTYINAGRTGMLGAPTYPMLRDATQSTLFEILDRSGIPYEHNKAENTLTMKDTRSRVLFRAVDEFERLRGTNLAWFGVDELTYCQEQAWVVLEGRLRDPRAKRLCGFAAWTPKGHDWVYRRFLEEPVAGYEAIVSKPFENSHLLSRIPDFYERLKSSYDARFYQQEVLGEYLNINGGLVYYAFRRGEHVADIEIDPWVPVLWALDFNVDPMCS
ncbi:MAG: terminase family protein, partial [Bryobacteraceae bacterium]